MRNNRTVDVATRNFTTSYPPPSITFDFGGTGATNFRMRYRGVTSISVNISTGAGGDVNHIRSGLDPVENYSHVATRRRVSAVPGLTLVDMRGMTVRAEGPGGSIVIDYESRFAQQNQIRAYYRARGWSVGNEDGLVMSRNFGQGTYTYCRTSI